MKSVLIIGGGFAGSSIAKKLQNDFRVTLVDKKDYFEYKPGILRIAADPTYEKKLIVKHSSYLKRAKIVVGKVTKLTKTYAIVKGKKIHFDYAVIASGATYIPFLSGNNVVIASDIESIKSKIEDVKKAQRVLVVGGGSVGVELAGELCLDKHVTLVHAGTRLLERNALGSSKTAQKYLEKRNVKIMFDEKVAHYREGSFVTRKGTQIEGDMAFLCTGIMTNADYLEDNFNSSLNEHKAVMVDEFLRVKNTKNIFATGDVTDIREEKTAQAAEKQANVVVENIRRLERKFPLKKYVSSKRPMIISLGKWNGIIEYRKLVITGIFPAFVKKIVEIKSMLKR